MLALTVDHDIGQEDAPARMPLLDADAEIALVDVELALIDLLEQADEDTLGDPLVVAGRAGLRQRDSFDTFVLLLLSLGPSKEVIQRVGLDVMQIFHGELAI